MIYIRFITPYNRDNFPGYLPGIPRVGDTILHPDTGEWRVTRVEWLVLKGARPGDCHVSIERAA